ncbi:Lipocalin-like domain-containing protein [Tenacibaculum sp. 190524A05c]|uniref:hypothetical protein n=1 Tax=Tenacibaculum platacis TaxID=3137852 RepID=UPI0031FB34DA
MKKLLLLFVSMSLFVSCSDDNGETLVDVDASEIVGKWDLIELTANGKSTNETLGQSVETEFSTLGKDFDFEVEFTNNPQNVTGTGSYNSVVTYTALGQTTTEVIPTTTANGLEDATWDVNGGILKITPSIQTALNLASDAKIIEFDGEKMRLKFDINQSAEGEEQGISFKISATGTAYLTLKKQVSTAL